MSFDPSRLFDMTGRIALITGGGTGIGLYIAKGLAVNGAKVYITGRRVDVLEKAASEFQGSGSLVPLPMDVTNNESIKNGVKVIAEKEGRLDILVNNAGIATPLNDPDFTAKKFEYFNQQKLPYELETFEGWHSVFKVNTFAPFFVTTAFIDLLTKGAEARKDTSVVINISSMSASFKSQTPVNTFAYGITKAALNQITVTMASDLARKKIPIRVNSIEPGIIPSEILDSKIFDEYLNKPFPGLNTVFPLGRFGTPEEVALSAIYFAAVGFSNGATLRMDGGLSLVEV